MKTLLFFMISICALTMCVIAGTGYGNEGLYKQDTLVAWGGASGSYSIIRFTGALYTPGQLPDDARALRTLEVLIEGKEPRVFLIEKARNLSGVETEVSLLKSIFPPIITVWGTKDLISYLHNPHIEGKPLVVQGHLYRSPRRFNVLFIEEVEQGEYNG